MSVLTPQNANMWIERVFSGDFRGRDGIKSLLDYLSEHGGTCRMVDKDQTLSVSVPVGGKPVRVIAFMMYRGAQTFQITFVDFHKRVSYKTLTEAAERLSERGRMINAVNEARKKDFESKTKTPVVDVFPYPERVDAVTSALDLIMANSSAA